MIMSQIWKNKTMGFVVGTEGLRSRVCGERERQRGENGLLRAWKWCERKKKKMAY